MPNLHLTPGTDYTIFRMYFTHVECVVHIWEKCVLSRSKYDRPTSCSTLRYTQIPSSWLSPAINQAYMCILALIERRRRVPLKVAGVTYYYSTQYLANLLENWQFLPLWEPVNRVLLSQYLKRTNFLQPIDNIFAICLLLLAKDWSDSLDNFLTDADWNSLSGKLCSLLTFERRLGHGIYEPG